MSIHCQEPLLQLVVFWMDYTRTFQVLLFCSKQFFQIVVFTERNAWFIFIFFDSPLGKEFYFQCKHHRKIHFLEEDHGKARLHRLVQVLAQVNGHWSARKLVFLISDQIQWVQEGNLLQVGDWDQQVQTNWIYLFLIPLPQHWLVAGWKVNRIDLSTWPWPLKSPRLDSSICFLQLLKEWSQRPVLQYLCHLWAELIKNNTLIWMIFLSSWA